MNMSCHNCRALRFQQTMSHYNKDCTQGEESSRILHAGTQLRYVVRVCVYGSTMPHQPCMWDRFRHRQGLSCSPTTCREPLRFRSHQRDNIVHESVPVVPSQPQIHARTTVASRYAVLVFIRRPRDSGDNERLITTLIADVRTHFVVLHRSQMKG